MLHSNNMPKKISREDTFCPICLNAIENETSPDGCGHRFCHHCIKKWSRVRLPTPRRRTRVRSASNPSPASSGSPERRKIAERACRSVANGRKRTYWRTASSMPSADGAHVGESAKCLWPMRWLRPWPSRTDLNVILQQNILHHDPIPLHSSNVFSYNYNNSKTI